MRNRSGVDNVVNAFSLRMINMDIIIGRISRECQQFNWCWSNYSMLKDIAVIPRAINVDNSHVLYTTNIKIFVALNFST